MKRFLFSLLLLCPFQAQAATLQCGYASFYGGHGDPYAWGTMANGQAMNPVAMITAHKTLPFGTRIKVTNQVNGRSVIVRVADRGPFVHGRILDLSFGSFSRIAPPSNGVIPVCFSVIR